MYTKNMKSLDLVSLFALTCCSLSLVKPYKLDKSETAFIHHPEPSPQRKIRNTGESALVHATPSPPTSTTEPVERNTISSSVSEKYDTSARSTRSTVPTDDQPPTTTSKEVFDKPTTVDSKGCKDKQHYHPETDKCYNLASTGPCNSSDWYIMNKKSGEASCEKRECPMYYAKYDGRCILLSNAENEGACKRGEQLYNNIYGRSSCDCRPLHYRWSEDELCYPVYYRGPCQRQQHFVYNDETDRAECVTNECKQDGLIKIDGECWPLGALCGDNNEKNIYINPHTGKPGCFDFFRPGV